MFLILLCGVLLLVFLRWDGIFLCGWGEKRILADPDRDGLREEMILSRQRFSLRKEGRELWRTEAGWRVQDFLLGDIDRDGREELLLLVWKRGNYGSAHPFWEQAAEDNYSQHIFLYRWGKQGLHPFWMSSRLCPEVRNWALEGDRIHIRTASGEDTLWGWRAWGLERLDSERIAF